MDIDYPESTDKEKAVYEKEIQWLRVSHVKTVTLLEGVGKNEGASKIYLVEKILRFLDANS